MNIIDNLDNQRFLNHILTEFVVCIICKEIYEHIPATDTLNRHKCNTGAKSQRTIDMFTRNSSEKKNIKNILR